MAVSVLAASACADLGDSDSTATRQVGAPVADADDAGGAGGAEAIDVAERHRIRRAEVTLAVDDDDAVDVAATAIVERAIAADGVVDNDQRARPPHASASLVLRVPPERLDSFVAQLAEVGDVRNSAITTDDVTAEYTDLEGRVENLRASVTRVRELMADAEDVIQIAALEGELSRREQDLESAEGQLRVLRDQVALSTVSVYIETREQAASDTAPGPAEALSNGWTAFVTVLAWSFAGLLAGLPFLVTAGALLLAWRAYRRRHPRRPRPAPPGWTSPPPPAGPPPSPPDASAPPASPATSPGVSPGASPVGDQDPTDAEVTTG